MFRIFNIAKLIVCILFLLFQSPLQGGRLEGNSKYSYEDYREARIRRQKNHYNRVINQKNHSIRQSTQKKSKNKTRKKNTSKKTSYKNKKGAFTYYKIKKGDTLLGIAHKFKVSYQDISKANNLKNKNKIYAGMTLKIPTTKMPKNNNSGKNTASKNRKKPSFVWPLKKVMSYKRDGGNGIRSLGLIIKSKPYTGVYPAATGVVKKVGEMRGFGKYIVILHDNRYATVYSNLNKIYVQSGDRVKTNAPIGNISNTILHFQIDLEGKPCNPLEYLPKKS